MNVYKWLAVGALMLVAGAVVVVNYNSLIADKKDRKRHERFESLLDGVHELSLDELNHRVRRAKSTLYPADYAEFVRLTNAYADFKRGCDPTNWR